MQSMESAEPYEQSELYKMRHTAAHVMAQAVLELFPGAKIGIGPETADLLVTAIYDQNRNYLGPMVTWELITEKLETERKIQEGSERERKQAEELRAKVERILEVVNAASKGDLTRELTVSGSGGRPSSE